MSALEAASGGQAVSFQRAGDATFIETELCRGNQGVLNAYATRALAENAGAANPPVRSHRAALVRKGRLLGVAASFDTIPSPTTLKIKMRVVGRDPTTKLPSTILHPGMYVAPQTLATFLLGSSKEIQMLFPTPVDVEEDLLGLCYLQFVSEVYNTSAAQSGGVWHAASIRGEQVGSGATWLAGDLAHPTIATIDTAFVDNPAVGGLSSTDNFASIAWRWLWQQR